MNNILQNMTPRSKSIEGHLKAYPKDLDTFHRFIEFLNETAKEDGVFLEEDLFSNLIRPLNEIEDFQNFINGRKKKRKKRSSEE